MLKVCSKTKEHAAFYNETHAHTCPEQNRRSNAYQMSCTPCVGLTSCEHRSWKRGTSNFGWRVGSSRPPRMDTEPRRRMFERSPRSTLMREMGGIRVTHVADVDIIVAFYTVHKHPTLHTKPRRGMLERSPRSTLGTVAFGSKVDFTHR